MPHANRNGGYPVGSVAHIPKTIKRHGAFLRYIAAGNVVWLLKPDIDAHYAQIKHDKVQGSPEPLQLCRAHGKSER